MTSLVDIRLHGMAWFASLLIKDDRMQQEIAEHNLVVKSNISGVCETYVGYWLVQVHCRQLLF